jgi:hypothetical protein
LTEFIGVIMLNRELFILLGELVGQNSGDECRLKGGCYFLEREFLENELARSNFIMETGILFSLPTADRHNTQLYNQWGLSDTVICLIPIEDL